MFIYEVLQDGTVFSKHTYLEGDPLPPSLREGRFFQSDADYSLGKVHFKDGNFVEEQLPVLLEDLKLIKWREIKDKRDQAEFGPFTYNNMIFDGDADAQRRLMVYISLSKSALEKGQNITRAFILADNSVVTLEAADFVGIEQAKADQVAEVFNKAILLRDRITNASSSEELQAISWE